MKTLYLMRHGETLFNNLKKIQGACDSPLTKNGIEQAKQARRFIQNIAFDHAYSSTSERSCDTLEIISQNSLPYTRLKGLKEMNFGVFEGESEHLNPKDYEAFDSFFLQFGGESREMVKNRMVNTLTSIMELEDHQNVLAVSHAGACFHFISAWQDVSEIRKQGIPNCTIFKFSYDQKKFKLLGIYRLNEK